MQARCNFLKLSIMRSRTGCIPFSITITISSPCKVGTISPSSRAALNTVSPAAWYVRTAVREKENWSEIVLSFSIKKVTLY